jgi:transcriptional regulator with XRE-family HTH domain
MTSEQWRSQFADNLRAALDISGMRPTDLAFHARISDSNISKYLAGTQMPTARALVNMSEALGVSVDDLVCFGGFVD